MRLSEFSIDDVRRRRDGNAVIRVPSSVRLSRGSVILIASVVVMTAASMIAHLAGGEGPSGEAAEHAERVGVLTVVGPLAALLLLGVVWLLRGRSLRPVWFLFMSPLAF